MEDDYLQPDFYHFNEDSIILAEYAAKLIIPKDAKLLDLGAGCGVVALEISERNKNITKITFLEVQEAFSDYLEFNAKKFAPGRFSEIQINSFQNFASEDSFDLIVGNLPYFDLARTRVSSDVRKNQCRQFTVVEFQSVIRILEENLSISGQGLCLIHDHFIGEIHTSLKTKQVWKKHNVQIIYFCR